MPPRPRGHAARRRTGERGDDHDREPNADLPRRARRGQRLVRAWSGGLNDEFLDLSDFAPITLGAGAVNCTLSTAGGKHFASCEPGEVDAIRYEGGDGNDTLSIQGGVQLPGGAVLDGGDGDDTLGGPSREQPGVT